MKLPPFPRLSMAALCGLLAMPAAFAAGGPSVTGKLSNFKFGVVDLTPNDGVAATYRINNESVHIENKMDHAGSAKPQTVDLTLAAGDAVVSHLYQGPLHTTIQSNGTIGDVSLEVRRDAASPLRHKQNFFKNKYTYTADLTLSPGAALLVSGNVLQQFIPGGIHKYDSANTNLSVRLAERSGAVNNQTTYDSFFTNFYQQYSRGWNYQGEFSLALVNLSSRDITVDMDFSFSSVMSATQPLSAVPEPGSYALFGAGLALLGWRARRRRA
ncbi:PEP-CTERM sorting domain-containing protein [Massilia sp. BJB1822]|uniref:PEP-CTERM sorting domain-containing protein n=1 Tax=Massilia sp. BJB1822 TaxID=2744470 RepID=UPI0015948A1B|nr:PEP-CTERM sorting domain-containing protein [Massilia sp. BJB1822]NVD99698.1 PEP-CTERM sorting domain-containing protein [Massilia sp. BJB1822]